MQVGVLDIGGSVPTLQSALPQPALRPFVRAYAQRKLDAADPVLIEAVPAQLEQVLNFELGVLPNCSKQRMVRLG